MGRSLQKKKNSLWKRLIQVEGHALLWYIWMSNVSLYTLKIELVILLIFLVIGKYVVLLKRGEVREPIQTLSNR